MLRITVTDLPATTRIRLDPAGNDAFWDNILADGITAFADQHGLDRTTVYNWRHHTEYYPASIVTTVLDDPDAHVTAVKGGGRGPGILATFPLEVSAELLTRIQCSVHRNADGVPVYTAGDPGLVERFYDLLDGLGEVPVVVYHRSAYEVRYPKVLDEILRDVPYDPDSAARIDEVGRIEGEDIVLGDERIPIAAFDGELYHRGKKLQLALARSDSDILAEIMRSEATRVRELGQ